jgi:lipopolysaccharide transport system permease protein
LRSHLRLVLRIAQNELVARFAGSVFGAGWAILTPLVLLTIYAVVYLLIFKVRVPSLSGPEYVLLIFVGLVPFLMTSEALVGGVSSVISNKAFLSNTVFPIDLVPVKSVLLSQITMIVGMAVVIIMTLMLGRLSKAIVFMPIVWGLHILFLIGISWILSLINLVFRDLQNVIGLLITWLLIASPIAYTPEMVPPQLKLILLLNPLAYFIVAYQDTIVFGHIPDVGLWLALVGISITTFLIGGFFFAKAKATLIDHV